MQTPCQDCITIPVRPVRRGSVKPRPGLVVLLVTAALAVSWPARASDSGGRHVLLLHSDNVRLPVGQIQDAVFRDVLTR